MLSKRLVVLGIMVIVPAWLQVSPVPGTARVKVSTPVRRHAPIRILSAEDGAVTSLNWSGKVATGSNVTKAEGSWIVPKVKCNSGDTYSSFWVGIDGYSDLTVEQTGTDSDCNGSTPVYYAWHEYYPNPPRLSPVTIHAGDVMSASVTYSNGKFTTKITNVTTGHWGSSTATVSGAQRTSAEWIAEAPSSGGLVLPLADFGTVYFGDDHTGVSSTCHAKIGSKSGPIADFTHVSITMNGPNDMATPSVLSSDGSSFFVKWE